MKNQKDFFPRKFSRVKLTSPLPRLKPFTPSTSGRSELQKGQTELSEDNWETDLTSSVIKSSRCIFTAKKSGRSQEWLQNIVEKQSFRATVQNFSKKLNSEQLQQGVRRQRVQQFAASKIQREIERSQQERELRLRFGKISDIIQQRLKALKQSIVL